MVQTVQGGVRQAAGNKPGGGCRPAPCDLFLGTISGKRAQKVTFPWSTGTPAEDVTAGGAEVSFLPGEGGKGESGLTWW